MTRITKIILSIALVFYSISANADMTNDCMNQISNNSDFQQVFSTKIFPNAQEITQEMATQNKQ